MIAFINVVNTRNHAWRVRSSCTGSPNRCWRLSARFMPSLGGLDICAPIILILIILFIHGDHLFKSIPAYF